MVTRTAPVRSAAVEQGGRDRRPVGRPAVVGRVDGVVERGGAAGGGGQRVGVGGVDLPVLDRVGRRPAAAGEHPHLVARARPVPRPWSCRPGPCRRSRAVPWGAPRSSDESGALVRRAMLSRRRVAVKSSALSCDQCSRPWHHRRMPYRPRTRPRRADRRDHRRRPAPAGRGRRGRAVAARGRPRGRHGLLGGLPVLPEPRRPADPADHRRLRRPGRRGRGGRRPDGAARSSAGWRSAARSGPGRWPHPHEYALLYGSPVPGYRGAGGHRAGRRRGSASSSAGSSATPPAAGALPDGGRASATPAWSATTRSPSSAGSTRRSTRPCGCARCWPGARCTGRSASSCSATSSARSRTATATSTASMADLAA